MAARTAWIMMPVNAAVKTNIAFTDPDQRVARIVDAFAINAGNNPGTTARASQRLAPVNAFSTAAANQIVLVNEQNFQYNVSSTGYALTTGYDVLFIKVQFAGVQAGTPGQ